MATTLEPTVIELTDFKIKSACETAYCRHGRPPATHIFIIPCPCRDKLSCTPCAEEGASIRRKALAGDRLLFCNHCKELFDAERARIEPLP